MKLAFWRRSRGRHALGAAVTSIPIAPVRTPLQRGAATVLPTAVPGSFAPVPAVRVDEPVSAPGPRVELGFRDGSRAQLDPSSEQARALDDIAAVLVRKD